MFVCMDEQVEDGTGLIEVREWIPKEDTDYMAQKRASRREGMYIKVIGSLKTFNDKKHVVGHNIHAIEDFNEITHHFLEAIHAHLYNTRGPASAGQPLQQRSPVKPNNLGVGAGQHQNGAQQHNHHHQQQQHQQQTGSFGELPDQVMEILKKRNSEAGVSITEFNEILRDVASESEIRRALEHLCNEMMVYPTIDDNHYGLTG